MTISPFLRTFCLGASLGFISLFVLGCTVKKAPIEQVAVVLPVKKVPQILRTKAQKEIREQYLCDSGKIVKIYRIKDAKKTKIHTAIRVSFAGASYKLSPTVSQSGKKYSNIRWDWVEQSNGVAWLMNNNHQFLAKNCRKK